MRRNLIQMHDALDVIIVLCEYYLGSREFHYNYFVITSFMIFST